MRYCYEIIKKEGVSNEKYESAFYCSVTSVESVLSDYEIEVTVDIPYIYVQPASDTNLLPFTLKQANDLVKGAFIDSDGMLFPEFKKITPTEV